MYLRQCKFFVVDECDKVLGNPKMRADIQDIFIKTPHNKQVMMFSATMPDDMKKGSPPPIQTARSSCKRRQRSSSTRESSSSTDWPSFTSTSTKTKSSRN